MNKIYILFCLIPCILCKRQIKDLPMNKGIIQITDKNIDDVLDTTYEIVVMFCASYAGICMNAKAQLSLAANFLSLLEKPVYVGEVETSENRILTEKYNITDYPTFIDIYSFGHEPKKLDIPSTDVGLVKAAMDPTYVTSVNVKTIEQWNMLKTTLSVFMIALFETTDCEEYETYEKLTVGKANAVFFYSTNPEIAALFGSIRVGLFAYHYADRNAIIPFTGDMNVYNQMSDFVDLNELPLVIDYSDRFLAREIFDNKKINNQLVLFYDLSEPGYDDYIDEFYNVCKSLLGSTYCVKAELLSSIKLLHFFGIYDNRNKGFVVHSNKASNGFPRKYIYNGELVAEDLLLFLKKAMAMDDSLTRLYTSEDLPDESDRRGCSDKIVQKTFDDLVLNSDNDVMVFYMKTRCDDCISAELEFIQFSEEYEEVENLKFYRATVDRNEFTHKSTQITQFPAIRYYQHIKEGETKKKFVIFHDKFNAVGYEKFLRKYATVDLPESEDEDL